MEALYGVILNSIIILILGFIISIITSKVANSIFSNIAKRTKSYTDDFIVKSIVSIIKPLGIIITTTLAFRILPIHQDLNQIILGISKLICLIIIIRMINKIVLKLIQRWTIHINDSSLSTMISSLAPMARALIWSIGSIFYLQNMGVQMAALWALLSAGGIGAGLALKEPVQEFFEYITILLDKPFQNGQFINIDNVWATVERVGVRSTRLRSINGEIIILSNSYLTNGVISNYAEMRSRRLVHRLGVVYETPIETIREIPNILRDIIDNTQDATFDRCHFTEFGSSSLDFELVYKIPNNNYLKAMEAQQSINLEIMRKFKLNGIEFAFPTQTIHVDKI